MDCVVGVWLCFRTTIVLAADGMCLGFSILLSVVFSREEAIATSMGRAAVDPEALMGPSTGCRRRDGVRLRHAWCDIKQGFPRRLILISWTSAGCTPEAVAWLASL